MAEGSGLGQRIQLRIENRVEEQVEGVRPVALSALAAHTQNI